MAVSYTHLRKRLSAVKGGRFALRCMPAHGYTVVLSDSIGDPLDMIASGPAYPDASTCAQALEMADRYGLRLSDAAHAAGDDSAVDDHVVVICQDRARVLQLAVVIQVDDCLLYTSRRSSPSARSGRPSGGRL